MNWLIERGKEKSTWLTIITLISGFTGKAFAPDIQEQIATLMITALGLIAVFTKEKPAEEKK